MTNEQQKPTPATAPASSPQHNQGSPSPQQNPGTPKPANDKPAGPPQQK